MSLEAYVRISQNSGNPEIWAFEEKGGVCLLCYGSMVTGGLTNLSKPAGYGLSKKLEKMNDGYTRISASPSLDDIKAAKLCYRGNGSPGPTSVDCAKVAEATFRVANRPVPSTVLNWLVSPAATSETAQPVPAVSPVTETGHISSSKEDISVPWAW